MDNDIQLYLKYTENPNNLKQEERKTIVDIIGNIRKKEEHKNKFVQYFGYDSPVLLRIFNKLDLPVCKRFLKMTGQNYKNQTTQTTQTTPNAPIAPIAPIKPQPPKPVQPTIVPSNIQSMTSTERKNYLTPNDIEKLNSKTITKEELQKYVDQTVKGRSESATKQIAIAEFQRKIAQLDEKEKEEKELNKIINFDFNYNSDFQKKSAQEITESQRKIEHAGGNLYGGSNSHGKSTELTFDFYNKFSLLNIGLYPKLISIMLNPEIFCKMWYDSLQLNKPIQNPYNIVNELLHTFFIKCYEKVSTYDLPNTFDNKERKEMIDRDTKLFKSLRIQNLLIIRDRLIIEKKNNEKDEFNDFRGKVVFGLIMKEINVIKEDKNRYIFNYKLLNELQQHNLRAGESIIGYKQKAYLNQRDSNNYETVMELYYYTEQLHKSLDRLVKINEIFEKNLPFTDFAEVKTNIKYKNIIENTYTELISKFAQVLTYVKERNDAPTYNLTGEVNPRYNIILKYEKLVEEKGIIKKAIEDISRDKPIEKGDPIIKYYDFEIKYFNHPQAIGLQNPSGVYFDPSTWTKDNKGDFIGKPINTNFTIEKAKADVLKPENKKYWEHYKLGKINRYYGRDVKSEQISNDPESGLILLNKLRNFENIIIVGNGQSGAGKTAALISRTTKGENFPGLLPCISNKLIKPENNFDENVQYFYKASVKLINLYLKLDDKLDEISKMTADHYYPYNIKLFKTDGDSNPIYENGKLVEENETEYNFVPKNGQWRCTTKNSKENRLLDQIIAEAFEIREEEPTKNNPNSSRSHIVVCVTFSGDRKLSTGNIVTDYSRVVICDLAGVEDRFTCELSELIILDRNYSTKSNKYKTLNEVGIPFTPEEKTKMRLKPIEFDNFFCSNKYYTDRLFPDKILQNKKNNIDKIINYINQYNNIIAGNDPIKANITLLQGNFSLNPITDNDFSNFKNLLKTKYANDELIVKLIDSIQKVNLNDLNKVVQTSKEPVNATQTSPTASTIKNSASVASTTKSSARSTTTSPRKLRGGSSQSEQVCQVNNNNDHKKQINDFMNDFTKLPDDFELRYQGKPNDYIVKHLEGELETLIKGSVDGLYNMNLIIQLEEIDNYSGFENALSTLDQHTEIKKLQKIKTKLNKTSTGEAKFEGLKPDEMSIVTGFLTADCKPSKTKTDSIFCGSMKYKSALDALDTKINQQKTIELKLILENIKNAYFRNLIQKRKEEGDSKISSFLGEDRKKDYDKIKYLIQQLTRFLQLEFNCILRRKEGFMINTSLKEMQKFIGSILFESSKRRFNKVLIENNLLKMDEKIYRYNDYIKYNNDITSSLNKIKNNLQNIINEKNNNDEDKINRITAKKNEIVDLCKLVKKQVLRYFMYIISTINGDENKYKNNIDLPGLMIYICFVNTIISVLINDKINFDLILNSIANMGSLQFNDIFIKQIMKNINGNIVVDVNDPTFNKMAEMFSELYTENKTKKDFKILKLMYEYSKSVTDKNTCLQEVNKIFNQIFISKDGQQYQIKTTNANEIFDTKNKINVGSKEFEKFYEDIVYLWDKLNTYTSENIKIFNKEVKKATYDNSSLHPTPLLYSSPSIDSCVEAKNKFDDEYDKFYNYKKNNSALEFLFEIMTSTTDKIEKVSPTGQKISFPIKGFGLEIENSTLVIFTVINITPNPTAPTNNPPTPPFININKLKLIYKIVSIPDSGTTTVESILRNHPSILKKIESIGQKYLAKLSEYEFYNPFVKLVFNSILGSADNIIAEKGKNLKEKVIDFIDSNNATTLLGTVDFEKFTKIRDPTQPYFVCDDKQESTLKQMLIVDQIEKLLEEK